MVTAIIEDIKRNSTLDPNILECWYNVLRKYKTQIKGLHEDIRMRLWP